MKGRGIALQKASSSAGRIRYACLYEKHVAPTDYFSDGQKRAMLQNAVHGIDELRQVKKTADHFANSTGSKVRYDEYIS